MSVDQLKDFIARGGFDYIFDAPMKNYTTLKIGGSADIIVQPRSAQELVQLVSKAKEYSVPVYFMGNGSNILVKDKGVRGMIVRFGANMSSTKVEGNGDFRRRGHQYGTVGFHCCREFPYRV